MIATPEPTPTVSGEGRVGELERTGLYAYSYSELLRYYWPLIAAPVVLAGGCYAILLGAIVLFSLGQSQPHIDGQMLIVAPLLFGFAGILVASISAILAVVIVHPIVWSLRLRVSLVWLGAFYGGFVGFVAALPLVTELCRGSSHEIWGAIIILAVGPGLTTILGQFGGMLGGRTAARHAITRTDTPYGLAAVGGPTLPSRAADIGAGQVATLPERQFHFRLGQLMWVAVWSSLLLTAVRLSSIPYEFMLPLLAGWLVYQAATLWLGGHVVRRLGPWWSSERPAVRST